MAAGAGIQKTATIDNENDLQSRVRWFLTEEGPVFLVAKILKTFSSRVGPSMSGQENKFELVRFIEETENIRIFEGATVNPKQGSAAKRKP